MAAQLPKIEGLRAAIDDIDERIVDLVNQRLTFATRIGREKRQHGRHVVDCNRESEILERLAARNTGPLDTTSLHRLFTEIISASRHLQQRAHHADPSAAAGMDDSCAAGNKVVDTNTSVYAVFGHPVAHSRGPAMHNGAFTATGYNGVYLAFDVADITDVVQAVRRLGMQGASITIPHKETIIPHLDDVDALAGKIGAVNTIINRDGRLTGYNTDGLGAVKALSGMTAIKDKSIAIVGAGGAARAVGFSLRDEGARLMVVNRSRENGERLAADLQADYLPLGSISRFQGDILINTTPVGMSPHVESSPVPEAVLSAPMIVMDIVYNPLHTRLLDMAAAKGCRVLDGVSMFVYQGAAQFELWTGRPAPVESMRTTVIRSLTRKTIGKAP